MDSEKKGRKKAVQHFLRDGLKNKNLMNLYFVI